ncbi:MAG TPA: hypothetical protein VGR14_15330 [Verrucomicrobiae bacterium]|jgi:hypothetical protein|nr:hypothetical protein [Verrucomicrobiae bacterium]
MKRWAVIVAVLYALMLGVLSLPVVLAAFAPLKKDSFPNAGGEGLQAATNIAAGLYGDWHWWLWLAVMGLAQAAMLAVPVRLASRRPTTRRPLALTVLASGLMMGALVTGGIFSLCEFAFGDQSLDKSNDSLIPLLPLGMGVLAWCGWAMIFFRLSRTAEPRDFVSRLCRSLLKGSILELLIAVPTHIVARCRDYCCAGFMTFIGLTLGISVMLFSFGPGVFFLFVARWRRLHPDAG